MLDLSLIGKAQQDGVLSLNCHHLREYTTDRHRSVDAPPAGGGAGMVMAAEPWALALEDVLARTSMAAENVPELIIPTPSGEPFTQAMAHELASAEHLIFAPGRFEGIDERVSVWASSRFNLRRVSIGDYVLNGGEAAVVVMVEAITRLIPGVIGNAESLAEESHSDGLLEYPVYTKPASWRGENIPEVLLSGHHEKIQQWRHEQSQQRTQQIRPDLWDRYNGR